jgi:hypothetical protein
MSRTRAVQVPGALQADNTEGPATAPVEFAKGPEPVAGLRAADVDPNKIRRAVLTVDGWVCPAVAPGFAEER